MIRLDIFSDPVCPWCFIGKANLDRALEAHPQHPFHIKWHPFQLNPDMPPEGMDKRSWLNSRFDSTAQVDQVHERLRQIARQNGVKLDPDIPTHIPNTLDAHRLIHWAGLEGRQTPMVATLFRAYWQEGRDIGDHTTLADIAAGAGMNRAVIARLLDSNADLDDIRARDTDARHKGVNAVPTFLIGQEYVVSGAQPPEIWGKIITELVEKNT